MVSSITRRTALLSLAALAPILAATRKDSTMGSAWTNQLVNLIILSAEDTGFSGFFSYSPAPGARNLRLSIASQNTFDQYGNEVIGGGLASYGITTALLISGGNISFYFGTSTSWGNPYATIEGYDAVVPGALNIVAPGGLYINGAGPVPT
jgi:hypothetical protein